MPHVQTARGAIMPFEFVATAEKLFGEDFADEGFFGEVKVFGEVEDCGKCFVVRGRLECQRTFTCDRCLTDATEKLSSDFAEEFDPSAAVDDLIDVTELLRDEMLLSRPTKNLCKADCKGLCPVCGANLNDGDCGCDRFVVNPKFAALKNQLGMWN